MVHGLIAQRLGFHHIKMVYSILETISNSLQGKGFYLLNGYAYLTKSSRREFEANRHVNKKDFTAIEYLLRKGQRQLETYSAAGITNIMR